MSVPTTYNSSVPKSNNYDTVFSDKADNSIMDPSDFLNLMVTQMQNQDFTDPMDNGEMIAQMAQFSNMQMMQEMAGHSKTNYAISLVGKSVTASRFTVSGDLDTTTGIVDKVSIVDNEYVIYVGDKRYDIGQIMSIGDNIATGVDPTKYDLTATDITDESALIKWEIPTEDAEKAKELKYTVYYSKDKDFDTVEKVEKGTMAGTKGQKNITEETISGMEANSTYYVNVVVTNPDGTKAVYKPLEIETKI